SLGIASIDEEHKVLITMLSDFYEHLQNRSTHESINKLIVGMKAYIDFHFTKEEELMQKFEYPEYMKHKAEHEFFVKKVLEIDAKYRKGQLVLSFEITDFLKNWFKNHILVSDKNYTTFFIARGVK
ncbi:MAG: hypothetical protein RIS47_1692, partial [Bacteroidota bacterium]